MVYCFCQSEFPSIQSLSTYYNFFFTRLIIVSIYLNIVVIPWLRIILQSKALSTLIRFQTKTELFCSVFKKICVHTHRFRIVFARPHYNAVSVLKTLLYPQCASSNELDACAFQYISRRNWREIEATWKRLSTILDTHGRVVWRLVESILMTSPFSDSIVFTVHTRKQRL